MKNYKVCDDKLKDFLDNCGGREILEEMIVLKADECDRIKKEGDIFISSDRYPEANEEIRPYFLEKIYYEIYDGKYLTGEERSLANMTYIYQKFKGNSLRKSDWENEYEHATENVRIEDVVKRFLNIDDIKRNIKCPFHEDKSPSFKVYPKTNTFYCFGCQKRGSPIDFVMEHEGLSFKEAVHKLNY